MKQMIAISLAIFMLSGFPAKADIVGRATVIDGDTLDIHGQRIRLHGIDAPESAQRCQLSGEEYRCGRDAALFLDAFINGAQVACQEIDRDGYQRAVSRCFLGDLDINSYMVRSGWALAYRTYSSDYVESEDYARENHLGIWRGEFVEPWAYRQKKRSAGVDTPAPGSCTIKGNINRDGERIYHMPGTRPYANTRISPQRGERWFCSEQEAASAGWRPAN